MRQWRKRRPASAEVRRSPGVSANPTAITDAGDEAAPEVPDGTPTRNDASADDGRLVGITELSLEDQVRRARAFLGLPWSYLDPYRDAEDATPEVYEAERLRATPTRRRHDGAGVYDDVDDTTSSTPTPAFASAPPFRAPPRLGPRAQASVSVPDHAG